MDVIFLVCLVDRGGDALLFNGQSLSAKLQPVRKHFGIREDALESSIDAFLRSQLTVHNMPGPHIGPSNLVGLAARDDLLDCARCIDGLLENPRNIQKICADQWAPFELERDDGVFGLTPTAIERVLRASQAKVCIDG